MGWMSAFPRAHDTSRECVPPRRSVREARPALGATRRYAASSSGTSKSAPRGPDGAARTSPHPNRARPLKGPRFAERGLRVRSCVAHVVLHCPACAAREFRFVSKKGLGSRKAGRSATTRFSRGSNRGCQRPRPKLFLPGGQSREFPYYERHRDRVILRVAKRARRSRKSGGLPIEYPPRTQKGVVGGGLRQSVRSCYVRQMSANWPTSPSFEGISPDPPSK
jgi:hypothetical protein